MPSRPGEPHTAAEVRAQPDERNPLDGSLPDESPTFLEFEALVDAELEKLGRAPEIEPEPEVLGGCSCGALFFTYEASDEHPDHCRLSRGAFGGHA
jgi:hypothetical protein